MADRVLKIGDGFMKVKGTSMTWNLIYDKNGVYIGQEQDDMMSGCGGTVFLRADILPNGRPAVQQFEMPDLTAEEMASAE